MGEALQETATATQASAGCTLSAKPKVTDTDLLLGDTDRPSRMQAQSQGIYLWHSGGHVCTVIFVPDRGRQSPQWHGRHRFGEKRKQLYLVAFTLDL